MGQDEQEKEQQLLSDSQFELEADGGPRRGGVGRIIVFFGGSLLIATGLATIALYFLGIGPFEPPAPPLQAETQPLPPAAAPAPTPVPEAVPAPAPAVAETPPPTPAKGKAAKTSKKKAAPAKKKKKR